jgi:phosphoadenosine phosphosulfate reductase
MDFEDKLAATRGLLQEIATNHSPAVLANSLGAEDMVLTEMIAQWQLPIGVFCLDTGRLHSETYEQLERVREHYPSLSLQVYYPNADDLGAWVSRHGVNAFYQSIELRQQCCALRKSAPLERALSGQKAWITGMRREQSPTRGGLEARSFDEDHQLMKFNPLLEWSEVEVWRFLREHSVPYNALHDQHYPSIGCAPCTRAISIGEDLRAGRWWWENPETKECGLHVRIKQG